MPAKNTIKTFYEDGYYHVYNRGVEKRVIFLDSQDCQVFLHYLKLYLSPIEKIKDEVLFGKTKAKFINLNLSNEVDLVCFALMPNHFHLLLKQQSINGVTKLLQRLITGYVMYFNRKYKRIGPLFQGIYKACSVENDEYLLHLSRYIHLNPSKLKLPLNFSSFSSYSYYIGEKNTPWVKTDFVLDYFSNAKELKDFTYQSFVEDYKNDIFELNDEMLLEENCLE